MAKYKLYDDYVAEQRAAAKETYGPPKLEEEASVSDETKEESDNSVETTDDASAQTEVAEEKDVTEEKQTKQEKQQAALDVNTTIGEKSIMNGGSYGKITSKNKATGERLDNIPKDKDSVKSEALGGTISRTKTSYDTPEGSFSVNAIHYKGALGEFDYDPTQFELATISVGDPSDENGVTAQMPFLHYIGSQTKGGNITIPEGLKSADYMFSGNTKLETVPVLPNSLESAHCAFLNCTGLKRACRDAKEGETFFTNKMKDGTKWSMPANLKDTSGMFYGCTALEESFTEANDSLEDARWMYGNTPNMKNYTDCTSAARLRKEFQENMYTGSNKENVIDKIGKSSEKNISVVANSGDTKSGIMVSELGVSAKEIKDLDSRVEKRETKKAEAGVVESDMSKYTAGQASTAKVKDSKGNTQSTVDSTEQSEKKEGSNPFASMLGGLGFGSGTSGAGMMDRAFTTFLEYKLISKLTNSKLLGLGASIGLQYAGVLPKSMAPILETVGKVVGKDTDLGKSLIGFSDTLKHVDGSGTTSSKTGGKDNTDVTTDITSSAKSLSSAKSTDITTAMKNNGVNIAKQGTLLNIAETPESELQVSKGISEESVKALETTMNEKAVNGSLDEETKTLMADSYMRMMSGLNSYDTGAKETIATEYVDDTEKQEKATRGLGKTLRTVTAPIYDSLKQMDEKYQDRKSVV